jgi:hypothetical protein
MAMNHFFTCAELIRQNRAIPEFCCGGRECRFSGAGPGTCSGGG